MVDGVRFHVTPGGILVRVVRGGTGSFIPQFNAWRFYDSDAGEAASTPLEAQDTNEVIDVDAGNVDLQLRIRIDETGGKDGKPADDWQLDYDKNGAGPVNLTSTDSGDGIHGTTAGLTNDAVTTDRSSDPISNPGAGSFVAGEQSSDGVVDNMELTANNFTEHVYGIRIVAANVSNNDTFDFSLSSPVEIVNNVTPRITIFKTAAAIPPLAHHHRKMMASC